jgi:hypothetical protein
LGKSTKIQHLREKVGAEIQHSKQTTLGNLSEPRMAEATKTAMLTQKKQIEITEISASTREDELVLKVAFKLLPSKISFSRVTSELYFDEQKIDFLRLRILKGPLATDDSEFSSVLDMTGIGEGRHILKVEMYELWSSDEKLTNASSEVII